MKNLLAMVSLMLVVVSCASSDEPEVVVAQELSAQGKPSAAATTITCSQPEEGCVPRGYRIAKCRATGLPNAKTIAFCIRATCPSVYGQESAPGIIVCSDPTKPDHGEAFGFLPVMPADEAYTFETRLVSSKGAIGEVLASTTLAISSSIGESTQCGGDYPLSGC